MPHRGERGNGPFGSDCPILTAGAGGYHSEKEGGYGMVYEKGVSIVANWSAILTAVVAVFGYAKIQGH